MAFAAASLALASLAPLPAQAQTLYPSFGGTGIVAQGGYGYNHGFVYANPLFVSPTLINPSANYLGVFNTLSNGPSGIMGSGIYDPYGNSLFYNNNAAVVGPYAPYALGSGGTVAPVGPRGTFSGGYDSYGNPLPTNPDDGAQDPNAQEAPDANPANGQSLQNPQGANGSAPNNATGSNRAAVPSSPIQVRASGRNLLFAFRGDSSALSSVTITLLDANRRPLRSDAINAQNPVVRLPHIRTARYYRAGLNYTNGRTQTAVFRLQ